MWFGQKGSSVAEATVAMGILSVVLVAIFWISSFGGARLWLEYILSRQLLCELQAEKSLCTQKYRSHLQFLKWGEIPTLQTRRWRDLHQYDHVSGFLSWCHNSVWIVDNEAQETLRCLRIHQQISEKDIADLQL